MQLFGLQAKLVAFFFNGIPFLLEIIAGKVWLYRLGYLAYVFSKKKNCLSFQGEQLTVFVANDTI